MPKPKPWTIDEAAILLDGFLHCQKGQISRNQAVSEVSRRLRQLAINNGEQIDDIFRNTNGISFQMSSLESAYQGKTILKPATHLFTEVVELYRSNPAKYEKLLKEALAKSEFQRKPVPEQIKHRLNVLFAKIDSIYSEKNICQVRLTGATWIEGAERLRQTLQYSSFIELLSAYGYSIHENAFVRFLQDCDELHSALKGQYPQGAPFNKLGDLMRANPNLATQLKTISYASDYFYHMPYTKYLREKGILQARNNVTASSKPSVDAYAHPQDPSQKYQPIGKSFYIPLPEKHHASSNQAVIGRDRLIVVMPEHIPLDHAPAESDWAFLIQSPEIPCGMEFNSKKISQYSDVFTNLYPVFYPNRKVYEVQPCKRIGILFQHFSNQETPGWNKLQGLIFAGNCAYIFHLIQNHGTSVVQEELIEKEVLENAREWLGRFISPIEYSKLQDEFREQQCKAAEAERLRKEADERKRQEELQKQQRRAAETERLHKEAEERKRLEELREQQRKAAEAERLRKEAEERKRLEELREQQRKAAEAERLRKEAEERKYQEELREQQRREEAQQKYLEERRTRYSQLQKNRTELELIIAENKSWFGHKAKLRKEAQQKLASINQVLSNEFPDGQP